MAFVRLGDLNLINFSPPPVGPPTIPQDAIVFSADQISQPVQTAQRSAQNIPLAWRVGGWLPPQPLPVQPAPPTPQQVSAISSQITPIAQAAVTTHYSQASDAEGEGNLAPAPAASVPAASAAASTVPAASALSSGAVLAIGVVGAILSGLFGGKHG